MAPRLIETVFGRERPGAYGCKTTVRIRVTNHFIKLKLIH